MKLYHIFSFDNIYRPFEDGTPTFCPSSVIKTIPINEFTIKDLFSFELIGLCVENLYRNETHTDSVSKVLFVGY